MQELERKKVSWASWVESEFVKCRNARNPFERQWYLNLAFTAGKQYIAPVDVPTQGFRLTTPKAPPWRVRSVTNKIRVAVRTQCSKLTSSKPIPTVMPATNEDEDFSAASVGEQIIKSRFATAEYEQKHRSWVWWGVVCGNSFLKQYWDPGALDYESKTLPPLPLMPDGSGPIPQEFIPLVKGLADKLKTPIPAKGKICTEVVTPFHIYVPDLLAEDLDDQPYVIHAMTKSPVWVQNTYGFKPVCDSRASRTMLDAAVIIAKGSPEHLDSVMVKEVWIKPGSHPDFPAGGMLVVINGKVVFCKEEWPYPFPEYPFYKYNDIPTGGFYSDSLVVDLIPIQKEYNRKRSQMIEIQNTMGKPKLLYPKGSINPRQISTEPGQSIGYTAGFEKPDIIPGVEVPSSFSIEIQNLKEEFDDLSGQHEISRGQTSLSSLTSGTAIAYLQEQDDSKLNYQVASIENACETMGSHYLILASHNWSDERLIKVTGRNDTFEALHWKKGMLRGNTDVKIQTGSALPYSKAARQALLGEWMMNGWIMPNIGLEMMDMGGIDKVLDDSLVDKRQATRENLKMMSIPEDVLRQALIPQNGPQGEPPFQLPHPEMPGQLLQFNGDQTPFQPQPLIPVNSWDNHSEHINWHNQYRKTQEFELLSDLHKQNFELHVQAHQIAIQAQMLNMQQQVLQNPMGPGGQPLPPQDPGFNSGYEDSRGSSNFQEEPQGQGPSFP